MVKTANHDKLLFASTFASNDTRVPGLPFVAGVGYGHTGTSSLRVALEKLGYGVLHFAPETRQMMVLKLAGGFANGSRVSRDAISVKAAATNFEWGWQQILQKGNAILDNPVNLFYAHVLARFPDARVILTLRDPEEWADSLLAWHPLDNDGRMLPCHQRRSVAPSLPWQWCDARFGIDCEKEFFESVFGSSTPSREDLVRIFNERTALVRRTVPPSQLLELDITRGDGYEKLSPFLGLPVPRTADGEVLEFPLKKNPALACKDPDHENI
jgi:hypothetical protein